MSDFETVPVGTMKMLEQAEVERDDAKEQYRDILSEYNTLRQSHSRIMDRMYEVEVERDALAAQVEEVELVAMAEGAGPMMREVIDRPPAASLARRDLIKQAEALEEFGDNWGWGEYCPDHKDIRQYAKRLRRQAGEGK